MKKSKQIVSLFFAIALIICLIPVPTAQATNETQTLPNHGWIRIRYAGNGKYVDIPAEGIFENGTQLQLWDYAYGNQNQIFYVYDTGNGWRLLSPTTGKIIEVRNSSHSDYAPVAQWDAHELACGLWDIIANSDGTVSFRNKESGLYLNVCGGGDASNSTKIIQYHDDKTVAMKFYIEAMTYGDVLSATFSRNLQSNEISWTEYRPFVDNIINDTGLELKYGGRSYHPTINQSRILVRVDYLSPNNVANIIFHEAYNPSTWEEIKRALCEDLSEMAISALLSKIGFKNIPAIGTALSILQIIWDNRDSEQMNRFINTANVDSQGRCSGIIVYTYHYFTDFPLWGTLNNGKTALGITHHIRISQSLEYGTWTGDNFNDVRNLPAGISSGSWSYCFK